MTETTKPKTTTPRKAKSSLLAKLAEARAGAQPVPKAGRNPSQGYDYARAEDVIREAGSVLGDVGLVATIGYRHADTMPITSKGGGAGLMVRVEAMLTIRDPETSEELAITGLGLGSDFPGDKAVYKAMTGAAKYAYASVLGIPFGDDPEDEKAEPRQQPSAPPSRPAKPRRGFASPQQESKLVGLLTAMSVDAGAITGMLADSDTAVISRAIDALQGPPEKADEAAEWLKTKAARWLAEQPSDVPADAEDLPETVQGEVEPDLGASLFDDDDDDGIGS